MAAVFCASFRRRAMVWRSLVMRTRSSRPRHRRAQARVGQARGGRGRRRRSLRRRGRPCLLHIFLHHPPVAAGALRPGRARGPFPPSASWPRARLRRRGRCLADGAGAASALGCRGPASPDITASLPPACTVAPSSARIFPRVPAAGSAPRQRPCRFPARTAFHRPRPCRPVLEPACDRGLGHAFAQARAPSRRRVGLGASRCFRRAGRPSQRARPLAAVGRPVAPPIIARSASTPTVSPSCATISPIVPAAGWALRP